MQEALVLSALEPGEHMCWLVRAADEYAVGERAFIAEGALAGDKVLIVGPRPGATGQDAAVPSGYAPVAVLDPGALGAGDRAAKAVLRAMRHEVRAAGREGFRALRVLARMEAIAAPGEALEELMARELSFGELAADGATSVVCAYRQDVWDRGVLSDLTAVHPRRTGAALQAASFRLTYASPGCWRLDGVVDFEGARAFAAALRAALLRPGRIRLRCGGLELIDAAGLGALVGVVLDNPRGSVSLDGVNETVLKAWQLSGYAATTVRVQVRP